MEDASKFKKEQTDDCKYYGQQCQDDLLNQKFRVLHHQIVNAIIQFCKENDIVVDELHLNADSLEGSIKEGSWQSCTDSYFELSKFTKDYKDAVACITIPNEEEWTRIKLEQKPFIYSM